VSDRCPTTGGSAEQLRFVGDPVDVVTGANTDRALDFELLSTPPLRFFRHYSSLAAGVDVGLGPGHRHSFDERLLFDVDGMRFESPDGRVVTFQFLESDGAFEVTRGVRLERISAHHYRVEVAIGEPVRVYKMRRDTTLYLEQLEWPTSAVHFTYNGRHQIESLRTTSGHALSFSWDARDHLARVTWTNPPDQRPRALISYAYDARGQLTLGTDVYGHNFGFAYDARRRVVRRTDRRGYSFLFTYDADNRCVQARGEDGVLDVALSYDPMARMTKVKKGNGSEWSYYYDSVGTLLQIIDPYGGVTVFVQDPLTGRIEEQVDPQGNRTSYLYDPRGRLEVLRDVLGNERAPTEDPSAPSHTVPSDALGFEHGRLVYRAGITLPTPQDWMPGLTQAADAALVRSPIASVGLFNPLRDACNLLIRVQRADGAQRRFAYDPVGNVRTYVDADGGVWRFDYTSWNHLSSAVDPLGHATRYEHDQAEQLTALVDRGGTRSDYGYDLKDRLVEVRRHDKVRERYLYDTADRLVEKQDGQGRTLVRIKRGAGGVKAERELASGDIQKCQHDDRGRLLEAKSAAGLCTFAYDEIGRRTEDLRAGRGVRHLYASAHVVETRVLDRFVTRYRYVDERTHLVIDPAGNIHRVERAAHGVVVRRFAKGLIETSQFDADGRCLIKLHERDDTERNRQLPPWKTPPSPPPPWQQRYHYSPEGNLLQASDDRRGASLYEYDPAGRLTQRTAPNAAQPERYVHDASGNLLAMPALSEGHALVQGHPTAGADTVALDRGNKLYRANGERFFYDDRDHVERKESWDGRTTRYRYDSLDHLVGVEAPGMAWSAKHDALGRRTETTANGRTTRFYWDTDRLAAEHFDDGRIRVYVYADVVALVPMLCVDYASADAGASDGRVYAIFTNHLGCPEQLTDLDGNVVWQARHDPYGAAHVELGADFHQPLRWPGHYYDANTGLHYNRFREYDPTLGRYLQSDPLGIEGGDNLYAYAWRGNPLRVVDVRGRECPNSGKKGSESEDEPESEGTKPVREGDVDSFENLQRRAVKGDNLEHDHIPAKAAVRDAINAQRKAQGLGRLTEPQEQRLYNRLTALEVTHDTHAAGRTYKNRGGGDRQAADAKNLRVAAERDMAAHRETVQQQNGDPKQVDDWAARVHEKNAGIGLYDDPIPSTLWSK